MDPAEPEAIDQRHGVSAHGAADQGAHEWADDDGSQRVKRRLPNQVFRRSINFKSSLHIVQEPMYSG